MEECGASVMRRCRCASERVASAESQARLAARGRAARRATPALPTTAPDPYTSTVPIHAYTIPTFHSILQININDRAGRLFNKLA